MDSEEVQIIEKVVSKDTSIAAKKAGLKRAGELLEETYILNLPPDKSLVAGLKRISKMSGLDSAIQSSAKRLLKKYSIG